MLLQIPQIINQQLLNELRGALHRVDWTAVQIKDQNQNNTQPSFFQLNENGIEAKYFGQQIISALENNPLFISSALPAKIYPPFFRKYIENQGHPTKIDSALKQVQGSSMRVRLDLSATIFLSEPNEYDGAELVIEDNYGTHQIKLPAGHMILYPSSSLHYLKPVKHGNRITASFFVESMVRDDSKRTILFDMDNSIRALIQDQPTHPSVSQLTGIYHNLLRMWSQV
jgi:PKHD-type hydroxylase